MPIVKPRSYPIRKATDNTQQVGQVYNPKRFPEQGGLTSPSKLGPDGGSLLNLEPPTKRRSGEKAGKAPY